jgi:hypothetical protein
MQKPGGWPELYLLNFIITDVSIGFVMVDGEIRVDP